ncbi:uncharacterized protein PHACADRAFT_263915 [Phanerochaete carnosa HHB-10118-sp]|uniref:Uncharacterized protein n=1 Tax=Phanerochaete carnosa (strain HHB-10118-sp) TaxID=650164 RepID=K5VVG2_PHACS|nr:uncharacterized protein PHACADRAFT_263915 [Phanerochaete carnosa HHB-10118-sp]EKM50564.1 hypothetical protein PHACADRAFT_263915 [Phanerochaete carnosa HHB-10118-sp]
MSAQQAYPFLSQPPHGQDIYAPRDAVSAPHVRRRSLAAISNWASSVQPGAPPPLSPTKTKFAESSRAPEIRSSRRHSVKPAPPPPMEYIPDSPSSSDQSISPATKQEFKAELRPAEYAPVYVQLPNTPPADQPSGSRKGLRFRSLSIKPTSRSKSSTDSAPPPPPKEKKEKKSKHRDEGQPMQLATDLALAQLLGGGTIEHHIKQAAEKEAKRAGAKKVNGQYVGVSDVYRDAEGRVWRDRDEAWEYHALVERNTRRAEEEDEVWGHRERRGRTHADFGGDASPTSSLENYDAPVHHGKTRRRPEPLDLTPSRPSTSLRRHYVEDARREFLESSFVPPTAPTENKRSGLLSMFKSSSSKKGSQ